MTESEVGNYYQPCSVFLDFSHRAFWQCKSIFLFPIASFQQVNWPLLRKHCSFLPQFIMFHLSRLCLTGKQSEFSGIEHDKNVGLSYQPHFPQRSCAVTGCIVLYTVITLGPGWSKRLCSLHLPVEASSVVDTAGRTLLGHVLQQLMPPWLSRCPWVRLLLLLLQLVTPLVLV